MSTRKDSVVLSEVWENSFLRQEVVEGLKRLKLPIKPSEFPLNRQMAYGNPGNGLITGCVGWEDLWLIGPYIVSRLPITPRYVYWGVEFGSPRAALEVFAERVSEDDFLRYESRGINPFFPKGRQVVVHNLDDSDSIRYLLGDRYCNDRKEGAWGNVLCRAQVESSKYWLVKHETHCRIAVYSSLELSYPDPDHVLLEELNLGVRSYNRLKRTGHNTLADILAVSERDLLGIPQLGIVSVREIAEVIHARGLELRPNPQKP